MATPPKALTRRQLDRPRSLATAYALASRNRRSENVRTLADLVECADHAALDDRPETFDGLRVDRADHVLLFGVVNDGVRIFFAEMFITNPLIGTEQAALWETASCTKASSVEARTLSTTRAITLPLRFTAPTIGVLPEPMPPVPPPRLSLCRFFASPPTKASSSSTIPPSCSTSSTRATRTLWHIIHAVL